MSKGNLYTLVALSLVSATTFAAKERSILVQNSVRVGYDDNIYQRDDKEGSAFITDIVTVTGKLNFSSRSDMMVFWQPEFRYRMDADPKFVMYQDLYAQFNHAISQRTFFTISNRLRYQDQDGQTGGVGGTPTTSNQSFLENDLIGAFDYTINAVSQAKLGAAYEFRTWDDGNFGKTLGNDYIQMRANGLYIRNLKQNKTQGVVGANYVDHAYEGSRGGFAGTTVFGGVDQNFSPNVLGNLRAGYSFNTIDNGIGESDSSSPYLAAGLEVNPTARTSVTGTLGYSLSRSENTTYNAQDRFNLGLGLRQEITGKISVSSSLSYIFSQYKADYANNTILAPVSSDANEDYITFSIRGSYQINRNNFLDAGYQFSTRASDSALLAEFDRNVVDIGWRLRL